ncbi:PIN domain-containing protein [Pseudonocardia nantongensis]|uniref:PIN domain-containing protein n=1 Tax=Pseudonocardia nantongensis TaxID=1181885 RepID=UPI00397A8E57
MAATARSRCSRASLLDSTILIDFLRGRPAVQHVRSLQDRGDDPCTTGINVEEIVRGLRASEMTSAHQLFDGLELISIDAVDGWKAGTWRREFTGRDLHSARQYPAIVDALRAADAERWAHGGQRDARTVASTHAEAS